MQELIQNIVQWLHGMGIHPNADTAAAVGHAVGQAGATVGDAVAPVVAKMDMPSLMALAAALGWASGFRLYAVVFLVGAMGYAGWIPLPAGLHILEHPAVMAASGFMLLVEFFADKIPWIDSIWDTVNSVIRIPGGALLAAGVFGADSGTMGLVAGCWAARWPPHRLPPRPPRARPSTHRPSPSPTGWPRSSRTAWPWP